jgi:hypothetical protein
MRRDRDSQENIHGGAKEKREINRSSEKRSLKALP